MLTFLTIFFVVPCWTVCLAITHLASTVQQTTSFLQWCGYLPPVNAVSVVTAVLVVQLTRVWLDSAVILIWTIWTVRDSVAVPGQHNVTVLHYYLSYLSASTSSPFQHCQVQKFSSLLSGQSPFSKFVIKEIRDTSLCVFKECKECNLFAANQLCIGGMWFRIFLSSDMTKQSLLEMN